MKQKLNCVLLVDDDLATNVYNKTIITKANIAVKVEIRDTAKSALQFLSSLKDNQQPPELVFLDVNMPGMDGWEFLEHYNKLPKQQRSGIKLFMLTTSLNPNDKTKSLMLGADGFRRKPLTPENVRKLVSSHFPQKC